MQFGVSTQLYHGQRLRHEHLAEVAAHGFETVEVVATRSHVDYHSATALDELAAWLASETLRLHAIHAPFTDRFEHGQWGSPFSNASPDANVREQAVRETVAALDLARRVPVSFLVLHVGIPDALVVPGGDNHKDAARRSIGQIAEAAEPLGVRVALEVIPNRLSAPDALVSLLEDELDLPRTGVCLDFGHAQLMGDPVEAVETLSGLLVTTHVHDNNGSRDEHLAPFDGVIEWPAALMALQKIGYDGVMMLELAATAPPAAVLRRAQAACARMEEAVGSWR